MTNLTGLFDTHCHLNFSVFKERVAEVIKRAKEVEVEYFVVPGTDLETSKKAVEIAEKYNEVFAAVGIHPHHIRQIKNEKLKNKNDKVKLKIDQTFSQIKELATHKKVVAIGEIGLDKHLYQKTKYENYKVDEEFFKLQKLFFVEQLKLAKEFKKAVIIHNREAKEDLLKVLNDHWDDYFSGRMVFHCCQPDGDLLTFAKERKIFIGVDGDVTYNERKQEFVKEIALDLLVLETDSPFLSPIKRFPNEPKNLPLIAKFISKILSASINRLIDTTTENGERLFLK